MAALAVLCLAAQAKQPAKGTSAPPDAYFGAAQQFVETLLDNGLDRYGATHTRMWAAALDARDLSVPRNDDQVPLLAGIRSQDRAVGGANLYHDLQTVKLARALSALTGRERYARAVTDYLTDVLRYTPSPHTGLLGWGEHLYWHFYDDVVTASVSAKGSKQMHHEYLAFTPPFELLWAIDSAATAAHIRGLKYHFVGPDPVNYLFSRHGPWTAERYNSRGEIMPWIKHTALYAYSFDFLIHRTGEQEWSRYAKKMENFFWLERNPVTNLVIPCLTHPKGQGIGKMPNLTDTSHLCYWLYRAWEIDGKNKALRDHLFTMLYSAMEYAWDNRGGRYYWYLNLDGTPFLNAPGQPAGYSYLDPWNYAYGSSSLIEFGRMAAYIASREKDNARLLEAVRRVTELTNGAEVPADFIAEHMANAIHINLCAYELLGERGYLDKARAFADTALRDLTLGGLFVRRKGDTFYEAKMGCGDLAFAMLRLSLDLRGDARVADIDFSL